VRGAKPKPTHLKLLEGNPGRRPLNRKEPVPKGYLSDPPEWMSDSQRAGWNYAIEHAPNGLLKKLDSSVLVVWVVAEDLHRQATIAVEKFGLITKSPKAGEPMQNPYLPIINRQAQIMMKAAAELGFTPSSRSRVEVDAPDGEEDQAEAFFKRRSS
jgi:P27 family predicted phage terminase small subunit